MRVIEARNKGLHDTFDLAVVDEKPRGQVHLPGNLHLDPIAVAVQVIAWMLRPEMVQPVRSLKMKGPGKSYLHKLLCTATVPACCSRPGHEVVATARSQDGRTPQPTNQTSPTSCRAWGPPA